MKQFFTFLLVLMISTLSFAQESGTKIIGTSVGYTTLAEAVTTLNTSGIGAGGVTIKVPAGYTETAPVSGYVLTATGTLANPIIFQKDGVGANPLITAPALSAATTYDGVIKIAGGDYITFDAIDIIENAANTTNLTDWGYALVKASATAPFNGCQYVTIKNCAVTLNKTNLNSIGIYSGNHIATSTTSLTITATTDAMNNCKFFGNTISNVYGGISLGGYSASSPYSLYDQNNEIGVTAGNTITNLGASSGSVRAINAIYQNGLKVANNNISSSLVGLTTTGYGVFTSTGTSSSVDIYNNTVSFTLTTGTFTSTIYGINNAMGSTAASNTVNIYNNTIQNCNLSAATSGGFQGIVNSATAATVNIYSNTITGTTLAGTGAFIGIYNSASMSTNPLNMYSNTISNNSKTGVSGNMYCSQASTATVNFYQNNIFGNAAAGSSTFYGYYNVGSPATETYSSNTIYNLTHNGTGTLIAIYLSTASGTKTINGNTIYGLTSGGAVNGFSSNFGSPANIYQNKIYNLTSTAAAGVTTGISFGGTTGNIYNNFISDLKAPAATSTNAIMGINISGGTTSNLYFNSIYLNATSSSVTSFGTSGIYANTTTALDMRNNIVVNKSYMTNPPTTAGCLNVAFRRSSTTLSSYSSLSNKNCFFIEDGQDSSMLFYDGSNNYRIKTIAQYKTLVIPREVGSFNEEPPFVEIGVAPYNLHLNTAVATQCESGGEAIAGITVDFDGNTRNITTPDVGADEGTFTMSDLSGPSISYLALQNTAYAANTLTATIIDASGAPITGAGLPRAYFKINRAGTVQSIAGTSLGSNQYSFAVGSGAVAGDSIFYYVVAQDLASTPNVGCNPILGADLFTANPPAAGTAPTSFTSTSAISNYYVQLPSMSGVYTIDSTLATGGTNFNTFTEAVAYLNSAGLTGPVTFNVSAGQTWSMTCATAFALKITNSTGTAANTITFQKSGAGANPLLRITGTATSGEAGIWLNGADYVTFNGIDLLDVGTLLELGYYLSGSGLNGSSYNTIKNCNITLSNTSSNLNPTGVYVVSSATSAAGRNNYNKFYNNKISNVFYGYKFSGAASFYDIKNEIGTETNGRSVIQNVGYAGTNTAQAINVSYQDSVQIFNTLIDTIRYTGTGSPFLVGVHFANSCSNFSIYGDTIKQLIGGEPYGINISNGNCSGINTIHDCIFTDWTVTGGNANVLRNEGSTLGTMNLYNNTISNITHSTANAIEGFYLNSASTFNVYNNKIFGLNNTGGTSASVEPIFVGVSGNNSTIYNNFIYDIKAPNSTANPGVKGIKINAGTVKLYHNTILLNYVSANASNASAGVHVSAVPTSLEMRNNIIINNTDVTTGARAAAFWYPVPPYTAIAGTTNNNIYYAGVPSTKNNIFYNTSSAFPTIEQYKTEMAGKDQNSFTENVAFTSSVSPYNLHIPSSTLTLAESKGVKIALAGLANDIDNDLRFGEVGYSGSGANVDIGADEFSGVEVPICVGTPAVSTINGNSAVCSGTGTNLSLSSTYNAVGISYQWASATVSGGPYTNVGVSSSITTGNLTVPTYYVCTITCSFSGQFVVTTEKGVAINSLPTITSTPSSANFCSPAGTAVSLTAGGASTYAWSPAAGLSATTGETVNASPSTTTTYTITGTDGNSCVNTTTVVVTAVITPLSVIATATPSTICAGESSNITSSAYVPTSTTVNNYNFATGTGASLNPMIGAIELLGSGLDVAASSLTNIGFNFVFSGVSYNQFSVSCNGAMGLGSSAITSADGNNSTNYPSIFAAWDDMHTCTNGSVKYLVDNSNGAGNKILIVEWNYGNYAERTGNYTKKVQVLLYEGTNYIKFIYGPNSGGNLTSASTGIAASSQFNDVNTTTGVNNNSTAQDANTIWPASGTYYMFSAPSAVLGYSWSPATFLSSSSIQNPSASGVTATTTYTVTANNNGCTATDDVTLTVSSGGAITTHPIDSSKCAGETVRFSVLATGPGLTYQWRKAGVAIDGLVNVSALTNTLILSNIAAADAANYDVVINSSCGAPLTSNAAALTVKPVPTSVPTATATVCENAKIMLGGSSDIGTTFAWTGPNGFTSTHLIDSITSAVMANAGNYSLITSYNGCSSLAATVSVTVNPNPTVIASASQTTLCSGESMNLSATGESKNTPVIVLTEGFEIYPPVGWAIINAGSGPNQWATSATSHTGSGAMQYTYNGTYPANAWNITQGVSLTGGMTYNLSFWYKVASNSFPEKMKVTVGSGAAVVDQSVTLWDNNGGANLINTSWTKATLAYTPATTGSYFFGFNCYSDADMYNLYVDDIELASIANSSYSWTSIPSGYTSTNQNNNGIAPTVTTVYKVTAQNNFTCTANNQVTVTVNPLPTATTTLPTASMCVGDSVNLSVDLSGTAPWSITVNDGGAPQVITGITTSPWRLWVKPAALTTYSVTSVSDANCTNSSTAQTAVTVNTLPSVSFAALTAKCVDAASFALAGGLPTGGTYSGVGVSTGNFNPATAGVGSHDLTYTFTDGNGCTNTASTAQVVNALPTVTLAALTAVCVDAASFALTGGLPTGGTYSGVGVSTGNFNPATAGVGGHDITYSYTDGNGCVNTATTSQTVNALPVVSFSGLNSSYCIDAVASTLVGTPSGGTFSGAGIVGSAFTASTATAGPHNITYSYTDGNGCSNTAVNGTVVYPEFVGGSISGNQTICYNTAPTQLTGVAPSGGNTPYSYKWQSSTNNINFTDVAINGTSLNYTPSNLTVTTYYRQVQTSANSCGSYITDTIAINVHGNFVSGTVSADQAICLGSTPSVFSITQPTGGTGVYTYQWERSILGGPWTAIGGADSLSYLPVNPASSRAYRVKQTSESCGTLISDEMALTVNVLPTVSLPSNYSILYNSATVIHSSVTGGSGTYTYEWTPTVNISSSTTLDSIQTAILTSATTFSVKATDFLTQCYKSGSVTVSMIGGPLSMTVTQSDDTICKGESVQLEAIQSGGSAPYSFEWSSNQDNYATNFSTLYNPIVSPLVTTTYRAVITDATQTDTVWTTIFVNQLPIVSINGLNAAYCIDASAASLSGVPVGGDFSGVGINGNSFTPSTAGLGSHTLTYVYTDANGCTDSTHSSTTVNALPVVSMAALNAVCVDAASFALSGGLPTGGTYSGAGVAAGNFTASTATAGSHYIKYTYSDGNLCVNSDSVAITVNALPVLTLTALTAKCVDATAITLSNATPVGGTYSGVGVASGVFTPSVAGVGSHYIKYTYTDGNLCVNSDSVAITVNALPVLTLSALTAKCIDATAITLSNATPVGGTYSGVGVASGVFTPSVAGVGSHYIKYTYTDGNLCVNSDSVAITVNALPVLTLSALTAKCINGTALTLNNATPTGGAYSGVGVASGIFTPSVAGVGSHYIKYTYTDGNLCVNSDSVAITVNALPIVTMASLPAVCVSGTSFALTGGAPTGGTYSGTGVTSGNFNPTTAGAASHTITYTYTDGNGCTNSGTSQLVVNALPTLSFTALTAKCLSAPSFALAGGTPIGGTYSGPGVSSGNFSPTTAGVGNHTITYTFTDGNNCSNTITTSQIVNALPVTTITPASSTTFCQGGNVTLNAATATGQTYAWKKGNELITGATTSSLVANATGDYSVIVTKTSTGCIDSTAVATSVVVNAKPSVSITGLAAGYCESLSTPITLTGSPSGGSFFGVGVANGGFTPSVAGVGSHSMVYLYVDANNCSNSATATIEVKALPTLTFTPLTAVCINEVPSTLSFASPVGGTYSGVGVNSGSFNPSVAGAGTSFIHYTYTDPTTTCTKTDSVSILVNALPAITISGASSPYCLNSDNDTLVGTPANGMFKLMGLELMDGVFNPSTAGVGSHYVVYHAVDANMCHNSDSIAVVVQALPVVAITNLSAAYCSNGIDTTILAIPAGGTFSGTGMFANQFKPSTLSVGAANVTYTYTDATTNCTNSTTATTTVYAPPTFSLGSDITACGSTTLDAGTGFSGYLWSNGATTQSIVATASGSYIAGVIDNHLCYNTDTISVTIGTLPVVSLGNDTAICNKFTITLAPAGTFSSYLWSTGATTPTLTVDTVGLGIGHAGWKHIWVKVTNAAGCEQFDTITIFFQDCLGVSPAEGSSLAFNVYPNPTKGQFKVEVGQKLNNARISMMDMTGNIITEETVSDNSGMFVKEYNLANLSKGVYFIRIVNENQVNTKRIIVQ